MATRMFQGQLLAGSSGEYLWNNLPKGVVHSFTAEPFCPLDFFGLHSTLASVEITDIIHEQQFVEWNPPTEGQIQGIPIFQDRIRFTIKNTGGQLAGFTLYMSWA